MILQKEQFDITGMTCSACSTRVEKSVAKLPGIKEVSVNLLKNSMVTSYDESVLDTAGIVQAVEKAGYGAIPKASAQNKSRTTTPAAKPEVSTAQAEYKQMKQRLLLSALFTIPLFYISMGHMMGWPLPSSLLGMENAISFAFTQFLLLIPVVFINFKYYRMGFKTLFHGSPNMDSLIAIGSSAAIVYGIYAIYKIGIGFGHGDMATVHSFMMDLYFELRAKQLSTCERIAAQNGVGAATVKRAEKYAKGVDAAEDAVPGAREEILTGRIKATDAEITALAKTPKAEIPAALAELRKPKQERQPRKAETASSKQTLSEISKSIQGHQRQLTAEEKTSLKASIDNRYQERAIANGSLMMCEVQGAKEDFIRRWNTIFKEYRDVFEDSHCRKTIHDLIEDTIQYLLTVKEKTL